MHILFPDETTVEGTVTQAPTDQVVLRGGSATFKCSIEFDTRVRSLILCLNRFPYQTLCSHYVILNLQQSTPWYRFSICDLPRYELVVATDIIDSFHHAFSLMQKIVDFGFVHNWVGVVEGLGAGMPEKEFVVPQAIFCIIKIAKMTEVVWRTIHCLLWGSAAKGKCPLW